MLMRRAYGLLWLGLTAAGLSGPAHADWRYCLAVNEADRSAGLTEAFQTDRSIDDLERSFEAWLRAHNQPHDRVLCPRAADQTAAERDRAHASTYNAKVGNRVTALGWAGSDRAPASY